MYQSVAQAVAGRPGSFATQAMWYESPAMNFNLLAGHTYAMGVVSDKVGGSTFYWGASPDTPFSPYPTTTANRLLSAGPHMQALDNSGLVNGSFSATPSLYTVDNSNRRKMSLHIAPVPPSPPNGQCSWQGCW